MKRFLCRTFGHSFAAGEVVVDMSQNAHRAVIVGQCARCHSPAHAENVPIKYYNIPERKIITPGMDVPTGVAPKLELVK